MNYNDFILNELYLFREFDLSNFVANARYSLKNKHDLNHNKVELQHYVGMLEESSIPQLEQIGGMKGELYTFFTTCNKNLLDSLPPKVEAEIISKPDVFDIKPVYLNQYVTTIGSIIDKTIKGEDTRNDVDRLSDTITIDNVKKQLVRTSLPYNSAPKHLDGLVNNGVTKKIDSTYVNDAIIPFLKTTNSIYPQLVKDVDITISAIKSCIKDIFAYNATIENIRQKEGMDSITIKRINYVTYNCYRALMEIVSFLTYMVMRKINYYSGNINLCIFVYSFINQIMENNPVHESVSESLLPEDTNNLKEELMQGRADSYDSISHDIYEYNSGVLMNSPESPMAVLGRSVEGSIETTVDNTDYDKTQYEEANKMYIIISQGLDIISSYSDDYLLVFDDIISKAGFQLSLEDRFRSILDGFDKVDDYTSASNLPTDSLNMYFKMLAEIKNYGNNMTTLAKNIYDCKMKMETLTDRFENNINGEYANAEAVNELKLFMESFKEQYDKLTNIVAGKFMLRLKNINIAMELMNTKRVENNDLNNELAEENTNFNETDLQSIILEYEAQTDMMFESLMREYKIKKEMKDRGAKIIFEADEPAANNGTQTATQPAQQNQTQTTTTTQQTTNNNNKSGGFLNSITNQLNEWFNKLKQKLKDVMNGQMAKNDQEYIKKFKQELLEKDYTNLSTSQPILNYEVLMPYNNIINDINGLKSRVNSATLQKLNSTHSKEDIIKLLFPSSPPVNIFTAEKMADSITTYYKVGTQSTAQPMDLSGDALKTAVTNAVGYVENFYSNMLPSIEQNIDTIKSNFESSVAAVVKESGCDIDLGLLFTEEDNNTADQNAKNINNMNDKVTNAKNYILHYCEAVLTSVFDREKDYMNLLRTFVSDSNNTK